MFNILKNVVLIVIISAVSYKVFIDNMQNKQDLQLGQRFYYWSMFNILNINNDQKFFSYINGSWIQKLKFYKHDLSDLAMIEQVYVLFNDSQSHYIEIKFPLVTIDKKKQQLLLNNIQLRIKEKENVDQYHGEIWTNIVTKSLAKPIILDLCIDQVTQKTKRQKIFNTTEIYKIKTTNYQQIIKQELSNIILQSKDLQLLNPKLLILRDYLKKNISISLIYIQKSCDQEIFETFDQEYSVSKLVILTDENSKNKEQNQVKYVISTDFEYDLARENQLKEKKRGMLSFYKETQSLIMSYPELLYKFMKRDKIFNYNSKELIKQSLSSIPSAVQQYYYWSMFNIFNISNDDKFYSFINGSWIEKLKFYKHDLSDVRIVEQIYILFNDSQSHYFEIKSNDARIDKQKKQLIINQFQLRIKEKENIDEFNGEIWTNIVSKNLSRPIIFDIQIENIVQKDVKKNQGSTEVFKIKTHNYTQIIKRQLEKMLTNANNQLLAPKLLILRSYLKKNITFSLIYLQKSCDQEFSDNFEWEYSVSKLISLKEDNGTQVNNIAYVLSTDFEYDLAKDEFFREKKRGMLSFYKESNSLVMSFPELLFKFTQQDKIFSRTQGEKRQQSLQQNTGQKYYYWSMFNYFNISNDYKFYSYINGSWVQKLKFFKHDLSDLKIIEQVYIIFNDTQSHYFEIKCNNAKIDKIQKKLLLHDIHLRVKEKENIDEYNGEVWTNIVTKNLSQPIFFDILIENIIQDPSKKLKNTTEVYTILSSNYVSVLQKEMEDILQNANNQLLAPKLMILRDYLKKNTSFSMVYLEKSCEQEIFDNFEWEYSVSKIVSLKQENETLGRNVKYVISTDFEYDLAYEDILKDKKKGMLEFYKESKTLSMSYPELLQKFVQREEIKYTKN